MTTNISSRIEEILERRQKRLPKVEGELKLWREIQSQFESLPQALAKFGAVASAESELVKELNDQRATIKADIDNAVQSLEVVAGRYRRGTVNIGVSGAARMGKSTLLQSISGLSDDQIPTGSGLPVTAVRSRIFHSDGDQRAVLTLHTYESFRADKLEPLHRELQLGEAPRSIEDFAAHRYPQSVEELIASSGNDRQSHHTMLDRLNRMHRALSTYREFLVGGEKVVALEDLRPWVAYPTGEEEDLNPTRLYLAVRDARIESSFPKVQVKSVGIVDLPGLGEVVPDAERPWVNGLRDEVDMALFVKRPTEGHAYWHAQDTTAMDILDDVRGVISNRRDFVNIVINTDDPGSALTRDLRGDINRKVNSGQEGKLLLVRECDARSTESVSQDLLIPVLEHLATRLPVMDEEVFQSARAHTFSVRESLEELIDKLARSASANSSTAKNNRELRRLAEDLRKKINSNLWDIVKELRGLARSQSATDPDFEDRVTTISQDINIWAKSGFGAGSPNAWCEDAIDEMKLDLAMDKWRVEQMHKVRIEVSSRFQNLDAYYESRIRAMQTRLALALSERLGELIPWKDDPVAFFNGFIRHCKETELGCPTLVDAVETLLDLHIEYKAHLHPRVRESLDILDPETEIYKEHFESPPPLEGSDLHPRAVFLFNFFETITHKAAMSIRHALISSEAQTCDRVLYTAAEEFNDALIRSVDSSDEFENLVGPFHNEIWPEKFRDRKAAAEASRQLRDVVHSLRSNLDRLDSPTI